jgi:hypothetical protein
MGELEELVAKIGSQLLEDPINRVLIKKAAANGIIALSEIIRPLILPAIKSLSIFTAATIIPYLGYKIAEWLIDQVEAS